ncbi:MAG: excinuclease ABC subunit UvrA, partial [Gemmatimonadaceae bacterium]
MKSKIVIRGARQHNLKNIHLEIPRRSVVVITGPSGSGKSSLAFDTIYAEGQRRYVESLSAYARQFLERMEKPDVDHIDGLSPSIAIEQKNPVKTARSTIGTATEIYDYLRLLWARVGRTFCPVCGREMRPDTVQSVVDSVLALPAGTRFSVAFPLVLSSSVTQETVIENLRAQGFVRLCIDAVTKHVDEMHAGGTEITGASDRLVVVDRLVVAADTERRLTDAVGTAFTEGDGECVILLASPAAPRPGTEALDRLRFTERFQCAYDGTRAPTPAPQFFSFNNPRGACPTCNGFGAVLEYDEALIVPYPDRSLRKGAIDPWTKPRYEKKRRALADFARQNGIAFDVSWRDLPPDARQALLRGRSRGFKGIMPFLRDLEEKRYKQYIRVFLRQYQTAQECPDCHGARLRPEALAVRIGQSTIAEASALPLDRLASWLEELPFSEFERKIAENVLREARARTRFLLDVGLGYLTLDRGMRSLSGGE